MYSILIATYNGSATLERVLNKLINQQDFDGNYEIVVVDNASTDGTAELLKSMEATSKVKYVFESKQGKNCALNTGLEHCLGDMILLIDDDILVDENWLSIIANYEEAHPDVEVFGGCIEALWPLEVIDRRFSLLPLGPIFGVTDSSIKSGPCDFNLVFGGNMAVRKSIFEAGFGFPENVGPASDNANYAMGSETSFNEALNNHDTQFHFISEAKVLHIISEDQVQGSWIRNRGKRFMKGQLKKYKDVNYSYLLGMPMYWLKESIIWRLKLVGSWVMFNQENRLLIYWKLGCSDQLVKSLKKS